MAFSVISSMVLDLLDQLQIFSVTFDRIARAFNRSGATRTLALHISKAFDRVWHAGLLHNLALFLLFSVIDGFKWLWMESLYKNI